jgi:hypothetical protein
VKAELILIAIIAMAASLSAYAQDSVEDLNPPAGEMQSSDLSQIGFQQGTCTITQRRI